MRADEAFELTEPEPADSVFVTGIALIADAHTAQLVGYADISDMQERRILTRITMSVDTAEKLYLDLWKALRQAKRHPKLPQL
jgi:hypothetical protein